MSLRETIRRVLLEDSEVLGIEQESSVHVKKLLRECAGESERVCLRTCEKERV